MTLFLGIAIVKNLRLRHSRFHGSGQSNAGTRNSSISKRGMYKREVRQMGNTLKGHALKALSLWGRCCTDNLYLDKNPVIVILREA